ncbi:UNVERIFIED_CONTAM: hypothetical protein PYX00_003525 [Menopon gallinae]|uniref:DUF4455 domain-containing protein n=1 Tax=Menopon gallinae TaxID=328185 RepID=A0AAW2I289_9NEOP
MSYKKCMERLSKFPRLARSSETLSSEDVLNNTKGVRKKILPENSFEVLEVEHLNPFFISLSNGSTLAEKITSKRRARNEILMQKLADDLNELNMKIEENIRISTGEVKAHMADYKEELYQMLDSLDVPEVESYHETVFKSIQESAYEMKLSQIRLIKDLHRTLCKLERLRSKENEKIFHVIFQQIEKTAYLSPYEIQSFVEQEALKMNQLMLNNRRCYEDLRLKLSLIIEHTYKSFMDEVFCIREKWIRLNKIQVDEETTESTESIMIKAEVRLELQGHELQFQLSEDKCYSLVDTGDWLNNINDVKKCIDQHESKLIDTFKKLQQVIRKGLSCEFDDVRRRLNQIDDIQFQERPLQPLLFSICPEGEDMFYEFEKCWQRTLKEIKAELKYARDVILDFGNLWTRHSNRVSESKLLILKAVEKTDENDLTILQDLEVKVNLSIDLLRQEYNKDKIEPLYNAVVANLDTIKDKLESGYLNVVSIVEEYYKMMELEADVLSPEIKEFLYIKHAESSTLIRKDEGCMEKTEYYNATQKGFLKLIENLLSGLNSMKLWNSGMRSALERTSNNAREILKSRAEVWVASRIQGLARRYQCLLEMHSKRYGRIRSQIYEVRLQEIYTHEKVYEQHKLGMEHMYKKLTKSAEDLNENCLRNVDEYHFKIATTMDKALLEERAAIVKNYQTQINREKIVFNNEIETQWEFLRGEIETTACMIQQSNTKFMKSIKLFHENGNYDAEEAKMYIQYLDGIEKQNFNEEKNISKEVNKKESELRQKVSDISEEANRLFSQLYEELRFDADVRNVFNLCITAMKDGATEMKMDFESLVKYCNYAKVLVEDSNICLTQEHDASWFTFIDSLYKNINNLLFAIEPPQWIGDKIDESIYGESMGSLPNKIIQDPMEQRKDPTLKPKLTPTDIISGLFESSLFFDDAGKFQKIIFGGCVNHMDCIQKLGSTFYKSNKNLIRTDLLKISYDEFWKDIFQKFRNLALQLELDWVQITARFLHILSESKMIFKAYFKKRIKQLTDGVLEAFGCLETEFLNTFNSEVCTLLDELHKLKTKLLTLHGHSRNRKLLNDLEDEVVRKTAELDLNWEKFIKNQMDQLECLDSKNIMEVSEWQTLKCLFLKCLDVLFADELGQGVANTLQLIIEKGGYVCKPKTEEICATEGKPTFYRVYDYSKIDFVTKLKLNLDDVIGMEQEIETFFCEITQKINPENGPTFSEEDGNTKNSDFNTSGLFIPVIQPKFNFLDITDSDMKRLDDRYVQIRNLIKSKAHFQNDLIYGWLDKWKANVEKIVQLHSVKYCQSENGSSDSIGVKDNKSKKSICRK